MSVELVAPINVRVTPRDFDVIVDAAGTGPDGFTTLQEGDDAQGANPYTMLAKEGAYTTLTVDTDKIVVYLEPASVASGAITLSGDDVLLIVDGGGDIQGVITVSGARCCFWLRNGVDFVGTNITGDDCCVDGGGHDSLFDGGVARPGIQVIADDCITQNVACQTTGGGGESHNGVNCQGERLTFKVVLVNDADNNGVNFNGLTPDALALGVLILAVDGIGFNVGGPRGRVIASNTGAAVVGDALDIAASGDDTVVDGNVLDGAVDIDVDGENCVVVGNRTDGAIVDNSGTSTVGGNDETAF